MMLRRFLIALALLAHAAWAAASPITYSISRHVGNGTVVGTVLTNGTLGVLTASDILGYELTLTSANLANGSAHLVGGGVLLVGMALVAMIVFGPVRQRLRQVQDATERLGAGDLTVRVPDKGGDEVAAVARSFNRMADDLKIGRAHV